MQLDSLLNILKKNFWRYFILPLIALLFLMITSILLININTKNNEDIAYVKTINLPLINAMIMFQQQEAQMLLNSISQFRGWKESHLVSNNNIIVASYPHEESTVIGRLADSKCETFIELSQRNKNVGKICYVRNRWAFLDYAMVTILIGAFLTMMLISYFYKNMLLKIMHIFKRLTRAISLLENSTYEDLKPQFLEEQKIISALENKISLLQEVNNKEVERLESIARMQVAEQVSHDIRSPLAALQKISPGLNVPGNDLEIFENAIKRINDIANNLLHPQHSNYFSNIKGEYIENLSKLLTSLINEKRIQYKDNLNVSLYFNNHLTEKVRVKFNESDIMRILSNLINNSFEAISSKGEVELIVKSLGETRVSIIVKDSGKGMSKEALSRIGQRGFSDGKIGSGLGIFHAKEIVESFEGVFKVESILGKGTTVYIELPIVIENANLVYDYVYIDNDELCRLVWKNSAEKKGINILILDNTKDFDEYSTRVDKEKTKIYIDSDLGSDNMKGEDFAYRLNNEGYKLLFIATGYPPERFMHLSWLNYSTKKCPI